MKEREIVLEFYDKLLNSMENGKGYSRSDLYKLSDTIIETQLKPVYGKLISEYRIKEQAGFMLGWLSASKLIESKETSKGVSFSKRSVSKQELQEELKHFLEKFPKREQR